MNSRALPPGSALAALVEKLRSEADVYERDRAMLDGGRVLRRVADRIEDHFAQWWTEQLDTVGAAAESGYSEDHLRTLIREGRLRHTRNGRKILIRRCDLPRHPTPPESRAVTLLKGGAA